MSSPYIFGDPRLGKLDGFQVEIDEAHERADIILNRPPLNVVSMPERDQLRLVFETLDEDARVRVIVVRHGGQVAIRSRDGQGTVVGIRLPVPDRARIAPDVAGLRQDRDTPGMAAV